MIKAKVEINLNLPNLTLTAQDMIATANESIALLKMRVYEKNKDLDDKPFKQYSNRPISIKLNSDTAKRLKPKGGVKTAFGSVFYKGGYREYKQMSTGSDEVNLTLSGNLLQSIQVINANNQGFVIGPTGSATRYALKVHNERSFIGITDSELEILKDVIISKLINRGIP